MHRAFIAFVVASLMLIGLAIPAADARQAPVSPTMADFQTRLNDYLRLREDLAKKLQPLSTATTPTTLTSRQAQLAAAIRAARQGARQGDLIPADAAREITRVTIADLDGRNQATFDDVVPATALAINGAYPPIAALPTMPPLLLGKLPPLPEYLQYRFYGRNVVILDLDTELIIDYVPNVLPPR